VIVELFDGYALKLNIEKKKQERGKDGPKFLAVSPFAKMDGHSKRFLLYPRK
jgi:hypothetical protein